MNVSASSAELNRRNPSRTMEYRLAGWGDLGCGGEGEKVLEVYNVDFPGFDDNAVDVIF